jgi:carbamoyltransferase
MKCTSLLLLSLGIHLSVYQLVIDALTLNKPLIVGLNKYSHDAACCIVDSTSGKILFSQAKERITRNKHDGGAIGDLLRYGLESIDASVDDIATVVSNNHHHRVLPFERRLPFYKATKYTPDDYSDVMNLLPNAQHLELSHHLAHAWSVVGTSPFEEGLIVVMDGMGETYKAMLG